MPSEGSPDPVREPQAYQRMLLSLLGDDDPAEVQASTPSTLRGLVDRAGSDVWTRPEPQTWSAFGCLAHVADAEIVMAGRYRFVLAHDEPPLIGYDQGLWVDRLHGERGDPEPLLALFEALRSANLALWEGTSADGRARVGIHPERGPESFDLAFRMLAGHDRLHVAQAERAIDVALGEA